MTFINTRTKLSVSEIQLTLTASSRSDGLCTALHVQNVTIPSYWLKNQNIFQSSRYHYKLYRTTPC